MGNLTIVMGEQASLHDKVIKKELRPKKSKWVDFKKDRIILYPS
jgi:hypothetical protein